MNKARIIVIVAVFALLLGGGYFIYGQYGSDASSSLGSAEEGTADVVAAPDFTVLDGEGQEVSLSSFLGQPVVLNFWATWCGPCQSEMPYFEEVVAECGDEVVFMMVNLTDGSGDTVETASAFIEEAGYTFPVYYDVYLEGAYAYQVNSVPATYFIDADGQMIA